jgi:hypothetical protein
MTRGGRTEANCRDTDVSVRPTQGRCVPLPWPRSQTRRQSPSAFVTYACATAITLLGGGLVAGLFGHGALERRAAVGARSGRAAGDHRVAGGGWGHGHVDASRVERAVDGGGQGGGGIVAGRTCAEQVERMATAMAESGWFVGTPRVARRGAGRSWWTARGGFPRRTFVTRARST